MSVSVITAARELAGYKSDCVDVQEVTSTDYGLDGPRIKSRLVRDFLHTSRPALGPTQPPVQWVTGLSRG
jgi:hypothetical protein